MAAIAGVMTAFHITNVTFTGNKGTEDGGAVYDDAVLDTGMDNGTFSGNTSGGDGGALYHFGVDLSVTNSAFRGNAAAGAGGGMLVTEDFTASLDQVVVRNPARRCSG
jgi:hypothetical protein